MQNSDIFNQLNDQYKQFKSNLKGSIGELAATMALKHGSSEKLNIIQNVFVPLPNGNSAEIDIVIIHSTGIYVVECKNYNGWIFGSAENKDWTQTFASGKKYSFYNPVLQNRYHIKALSSYLSVPEIYFKSYIVFGEQCELKKIPGNSENIIIMKMHSLTNAINTDIKKRSFMFSDTVVNMYTEKISSLKDLSGQVKKQHTKQVQSKHPKQESYTDSQQNSVSFFSSFLRF